MPDTPADLLAPVERFLGHSRELLRLARANDWEAFETLLAERESGLHGLGESRFLIDVAKAGRADELRTGIAEIQELNEQILVLADASKSELSAQLKASQNADKGIQAYRAGKQT